MMSVVELSKLAEKQLRKIPRNIVQSLFTWVERVEYLGIQEVRKIKGYHDEPLSGKRRGQRSIRLSKSYRAIYSISKSGILEIIIVLDVSKHEY
jgi:proteic killer suppression protein